VQQWNLSFQHELFASTAVEVRYVGNRGTKLSRAIDINQVFFPAEFAADFRRAQRNLAANGNPTVGEPLTVFPRIGLGGFLQDTGVRTIIRNGEVGEYVASFLAINRDFFFAGEGGEDFGATLPISYFFRNPGTYVGDFLGNNSFSTYHSLQMELRRRLSKGLDVQANYTFGKVLTDFPGSQANFSALMDNAQPALEKMRPDFDITHTFNANFLYELPFGANQRFLSVGGALDKVLGGWNLGGILRMRSGEVVNIVSQRGTINRRTRSSKNTVNLAGLTISELQEKTGAFRDSQGRIRLFDPSLIGPDGRANTAFFQNPGVLQAGTLGLSPVSGPWYFVTDLAITKKTKLTEKITLQFKGEFYNLFNHTNFNIRSRGALDSTTIGLFNTHGINSTFFGQIDNAFSPRQMQMGLKVIF
ncbi:MAG: hypothetical protein L0Z53_03765, partial [Acidobacteriales bacterium]|nr:hypothetical protein [Terriglobales bacterium]